MFNTVEEMVKYGFDGFISIQELIRTSCSQVPRRSGVYLVLNTKKGAPEFLEESVGGHFKGKNPTVPVEALSANWVPDTAVLYIGKAGGDDSSATLQSRLRQYMQFGQGRPIGHWGGRFIWQLKNNRELVVCWKQINENPRNVEIALLREFITEYSRLPFANLKE